MTVPAQLARTGIRVNTVAFGPVDTPMTQVLLNDPRSCAITRLPVCA